MSEPVPLSEESLPEYLRGVGICSRSDGELVVDGVGEGNINWVRRARTRDGARAWVVKQARPALERFPEYRVSTERIVFEARYYETVAPFDEGGTRPRVHHFDPQHRVLVLEDLSSGERLDARLAAAGPDEARAAEAARALAAFLGAVHAGTRADGGDGGALAARFGNDEMRRLHGDHIFHLPYRANEFALPPAVERRARAIRADRALVAEIDAAYARYLDSREVLVHADVQPTNALLLPGRTALLDAEIAHAGDPAFDVGVLLAHLWMAAAARGGGPGWPEAARGAWSAYRAANSAGAPPFAAAARYAGIEVLRRTVGAARVPAAADESTALRFVDAAVALVRDPPGAP